MLWLLVVCAVAQTEEPDDAPAAERLEHIEQRLDDVADKVDDMADDMQARLDALADHLEAEAGLAPEADEGDEPEDTGAHEPAPMPAPALAPGTASVTP